MFLLRSRRPQRYGKWIDRMLAPEPDEDASDDPGIVLDSGLEGIEWEAYDVPPEEQDDAPEAPPGNDSEPQ